MQKHAYDQSCIEKEMHIAYLLKQIRVIRGYLEDQNPQFEWKSAFKKYSMRPSFRITAAKGNLPHQTHEV